MTIMNQDFMGISASSYDEKYLYGKCHIFALALHKLSKLPIYALMDYDPEIQAVCLVHATVKVVDKTINSDVSYQVLDISGLQNPDEVVDKYPTWEPGWTHITPSALLKIAEGSKMTQDISKEIEEAIPKAKEILLKLGIQTKDLKTLKFKK